MKIGLFFGSFNPIHIGHLIISTYILNCFTDKVWFVVSPQNPFKINCELLGFNERMLLVKSSINNNEQLIASDVELKFPLPSYTIDTLIYLKTIHPEHDFFLILGSDNFLNIHKWKSADILLKEYNFLIYQRQGYTINPANLSDNIILVNAPVIDISSTEIRTLIKTNKSIRYMIPEAAAAVIKKNKFYL